MFFSWKVKVSPPINKDPDLPHPSVEKTPIKSPPSSDASICLVNSVFDVILNSPLMVSCARKIL